MSDITDEELAEIAALGDAALPLSMNDQGRLIAAMRAMYEEAEAERDALQAEITWLKEHWIPSETPKG